MKNLVGATNRPASKEEGFALVAVLFFLLLAASILAPFSLASRANFKSMQNAIEYELSVATLKNLFHIGSSLQLLASANQVSWSDNTLECEIEIADASYRFSFINHSGLIDLNAASAPAIELGLRAVGIDQTQAFDLANSIVEFRQRQQTRLSNSVLLADMNVKGGPKHSLFEAVEELSDFVELGDIAQVQLKNTFSVHSRSGTLDIARAPDHLERLLITASQKDAQFIVNNSKRAPAFSLSITMQKKDRYSLVGYGVFATDLVSQKVRVLEPLDIRYSSEGLSLPYSNNTQCDHFFSAPTRELLARVVH